MIPETIHKLKGVNNLIYGPFKWVIAIVGQEEQVFNDIIATVNK